jgi:hypothetical protein
MDMASCQTKDYQEKLESLYNHTVPLIKTEDLARRINENNLVILDIRSEEEYEVSRITRRGNLFNYDDFSSEDVDEYPKELGSSCLLLSGLSQRENWRKASGAGFHKCKKPIWWDFSMEK